MAMPPQMVVNGGILSGFYVDRIIRSGRVHDLCNGAEILASPWSVYAPPNGSHGAAPPDKWHRTCL